MGHAGDLLNHGPGFGGANGIERRNAGVLLFAELAVEDIGVGLVEQDQGGLAGAAIDLAKAAAGGLEDHVAGAVALLGEDDAGEAAAIPAFLADLDEQDNLPAGNGIVEEGEVGGGIGGNAVRLVALVVAEDAVRRDAKLADEHRVDLLFETGDRAAVDGQLGAGAAGVGFGTIVAQEALNTGANDFDGLEAGGDFEPGFLKKIGNSGGQRVVVDGVGDGGGADFDGADLNGAGSIVVGRTGEAKDGVFLAGAAPSVDNGTELDVAACGALDFVDEDLQPGDRADEVAKLVGEAFLFLVVAFDELKMVVEFHAVENDFFGVDDEDEARQILEGFVGGDLLRVGIAGAIALLGGFGLVENLELDELSNFGRRRLGEYP